MCTQLQVCVANTHYSLLKLVFELSLSLNSNQTIFCLNETLMRLTTGIKDQAHQRQLGWMLPPELEHSLLPSNQSAQHKHHWYRRQAYKHDQRVSFFHHIQALLMSEHLHDCHGTIRHGSPVNGTNKNATGYKWTRLANDSINCVQYAHKKTFIQMNTG